MTSYTTRAALTHGHRRRTSVPELVEDGAE